MAIIEGTIGNDGLTGTSADDYLIGLAGDDVLEGGDGRDVLIGDEGDDALFGGDIGDVLRGGAGDDWLDGGAGFDIASYFYDESFLTAGVTVDLRRQGVAQDTGAGRDTLVGIEHVAGTKFADVLIGDDGDNWLQGYGGGDTLDGQDGNDMLTVREGTNRVIGGKGNDTLNFDRIIDYSPGPHGLSISLQINQAQDTHAGMMTLSGIENLSGSIRRDVLIGDGHDNVLAGDASSDILIGGPGNDVLLADGAIGLNPEGSAVVLGLMIDVSRFRGMGDENDRLDGGTGNDLLIGGREHDDMTGGTGVDIFYTRGGEHVADTIRDMEKHDVIAIVAPGVDDFDDLQIVADGDALIVHWTWGGFAPGSLRVEGIAARDLGAENFIFHNPLAGQVIPSLTSVYGDNGPYNGGPLQANGPELPNFDTLFF